MEKQVKNVCGLCRDRVCWPLGARSMFSPSLPHSFSPPSASSSLKKNQIAQTNSEKKKYECKHVSTPRPQLSPCFLFAMPPPLTQEHSFTGHFLVLQSDLSTSLSALWAHLAVAGRGWEGADGVSGQLAVRRELGREVGLRYGG